MVDLIPINPSLPLTDREEDGEPTGVEESVLSRFLDFLEHDIAVCPNRLEVISPALISRIDGLVKGVEIDIDSPLLSDDD
ncbi:type II toxin-antitoxin system PrlF family antitoxin [Pseudomonas fluorescens]|uniref:type II toxin-antitoxin system PrlF family antitoxin n=1 Tax=Pseudomonas fluorescens TaxID=294 RepID=UPI00069C1089